MLGTATATTGLLAGVFYGYACSVMPALGRADDRTFVGVMQEINRVILNPVFFAAFLGAPALTVGALVLRRRLEPREATLWIAAALVLHVIALGTTSFVNVPLNDQLEAAGNPARISDPAAVRAQFEATWVTWNIVRAALLTGALGCLARALVLHGAGRRVSR